jgi:hypothetical protein
VEQMRLRHSSRWSRKNKYESLTPIRGGAFLFVATNPLAEKLGAFLLCGPAKIFVKRD